MENSISERRHHARRRTCLGGRIELDGGFSTLDCTLRNASQGGARLALGDGVMLPHDFVLHVAKKEMRLDARLKWRLGNACGVEFRASPENVALFPNAAPRKLLDFWDEPGVTPAAECPSES